MEEQNLTLTERLTYILSSLVALVSIMGSVWYAAVTLNNSSRDIQDVSAAITRLQQSFISYKQSNEDLQDSYKALAVSLKTVPHVVAVTDNYVLIDTTNWGRVRLELHKNDNNK